MTPAELLENAAQRARSVSLRELLVTLDTFAYDLENEGRAMAPAFMREAVARLQEMARRDWAVTVLDAWAEANPKWSWEMRKTDGSVDVPACCCLRGRGIDSYYGTAGEARRYAAEAAWSDLPPDVRERIGARP
jgi:hypothetical protein